MAHNVVKATKLRPRHWRRRTGGAATDTGAARFTAPFDATTNSGGVISRRGPLATRGAEAVLQQPAKSVSWMLADVDDDDSVDNSTGAIYYADSDADSTSPCSAPHSPTQPVFSVSHSPTLPIQRS